MQMLQLCSGHMLKFDPLDQSQSLPFTHLSCPVQITWSCHGKNSLVNRFFVSWRLIGTFLKLWGRDSLVARASDCHTEKWVRFSARHFIMLASSVDRDANGGPVGWNWLRHWFETLTPQFTCCTFFLKISYPWCLWRNSSSSIWEMP